MEVINYGRMRSVHIWKSRRTAKMWNVAKLPARQRTNALRSTLNQATVYFVVANALDLWSQVGKILGTRDMWSQTY